MNRAWNVAKAIGAALHQVMSSCPDPRYYADRAYRKLKGRPQAP